ncbi:MAG: hypothetical protein ACUVTH_03345 [Thermogutta sp.]
MAKMLHFFFEEFFTEKMLGQLPCFGAHCLALCKLPKIVASKFLTHKRSDVEQTKIIVDSY